MYGGEAFLCLACKCQTQKLFWYTENPINSRIEIQATKKKIEWFILFDFICFYLPGQSWTSNQCVSFH